MIGLIGNRMARASALTWLLLFALVQCACTTMRPVGESTQEITRQVEVGDEVRIHTKDGARRQFVVTEISDDSIKGESIEIPVQDIESAEIKEVDGWKTAGVVAGTAVGVYAILLLIMLAIAPAIILGGG